MLSVDQNHHLDDSICDVPRRGENAEVCRTQTTFDRFAAWAKRKKKTFLRDDTFCIGSMKQRSEALELLKVLEFAQFYFCFCTCLCLL